MVTRRERLYPHNPAPAKVDTYKDRERFGKVLESFSKEQKPRYSIIWSHNYFSHTGDFDARPILGYFIQAVDKLPDLVGAKYYSL